MRQSNQSTRRAEDSRLYKQLMHGDGGISHHTPGGRMGGVGGVPTILHPVIIRQLTSHPPKSDTEGAEFARPARNQLPRAKHRGRGKVRLVLHTTVTRPYGGDGGKVLHTRARIHKRHKRAATQQGTKITNCQKRNNNCIHEMIGREIL